MSYYIKIVAQHANDALLILQSLVADSSFDEKLQYLKKNIALRKTCIRKMIEADFALITFEQYTQQEKAYKLQQRQVEEKTRITKKKTKAKIEEKTRIAKKKTKTFACRRCFEKYFNNIKLHEHVRIKHCKKSKNFISSASSSSAFSASITSFVTSSTTSTTFVFLSTTSRNSISWVEVVSRSKKSNTSSRLSRLIVKYDLFTFSSFSHLQSILQFQKSINNITKRIFITCSKTSYLTVEDLYIMFHEKLKSSNLNVFHTNSYDVNGQKTSKWNLIFDLLHDLQMLQKSINHIAKRFFISMFNESHESISDFHQMRITSYFKPTANRIIKVIINIIINDFTSSSFVTRFMISTLNFNKKHAQLNIYDIWIKIGHLTSIRSFARHFITHRICRHCKQHFSSENFLHRHLTHCSRDIFDFKHVWRTHDHNFSMFTFTSSH